MARSKGERPTTRLASARGRIVGLTAALAPAKAADMLEHALFEVPQRQVPRKAAQYAPTGGEPFFVMAGESEVFGLVFGDESRPPAFVLHGWGGSWQEMVRIISALVDAGYRVATWDAPGHGRSTHGAAGLGRAHLADMAPSFDAVTGLLGAPALVVSHGLGAAVALASTTGREQVAGHVMISPSVDVRRALRHRGATLAGRRSRTLLHQVVDRSVDAMNLDVHLPSGPDAPSLLVVHDQSDADIPLADSQQLVDDWPGNSELVLTDGLGHTELLLDENVVDRIFEFAISLDTGAASSRPAIRLLP